MTGSDAQSAAMPPLLMRAGEFTLRAIAEADWPVEAGLSRDADVVRCTFYPEAMDEQAARDRISHHESRVSEGFSQRFVILDQHGDALGTCGIGRLQDETPEVFYALLAAGRGRGAVTQATNALVTWAFARGCSAVALVTVDGNAPSDAVARRAGFEPVEHFEDDHRGRLVSLTRWVLRREAPVKDGGRPV